LTIGSSNLAISPGWVAIHTCMEAILGISLYSCLYPKLAKTIRLSYYLLCFLFNKIREEEGRTGSSWKQGVGRWGGGEVAQTMYAHVSKCKHDKIKGEKKRKNLAILFTRFKLVIHF
jgi:hypothetical protein